MGVNTNPVFSGTGDVSTNNGTTMSQLTKDAAATYTGVDADDVLVFTAHATNGGYVERLRMKSVGTNIATVARIYLNNGSDHTVATNNAFYGEQSLQATTAILTAATVEIDYPMNMLLNPGFRIYVGLATAVAAGWVITAIGGNNTALA